MQKKVDALGRIVIPKYIRGKYHLDEGVGVEFKEVDGVVCIFPLNNLCKICGSKMSDGANLICDECLRKINNSK